MKRWYPLCVLPSLLLGEMGCMAPGIQGPGCSVQVPAKFENVARKLPVTAPTTDFLSGVDPSRAQRFETFSGKLFGFNLGEYGGGLIFQDGKGRIHTLFEGRGLLLSVNVIKIVENNNGVFVFTGLTGLMGLGRGAIYQVLQSPSGEVSAKLVTVLPGMPAAIENRRDGSFRFVAVLPYAGGESCEPKCMSFEHDSVKEAKDCGYRER